MVMDYYKTHMLRPRPGLGKLLYSFPKGQETDIDWKSGTALFPILKTGLLCPETSGVYSYLTTKSGFFLHWEPQI